MALVTAGEGINTVSPSVTSASPTAFVWQPLCLESGMAQFKNVVGPQVRRIRCGLKLRQRDLAARLEVAGWQIDRAGVSKIESRLVRVHDYRQFYLAYVLGVTVMDLLPRIDLKKPIDLAVGGLMARKR